MVTVGDIASGAPDAVARIAVVGVTADSRAVKPGFVFAALTGVRHDGRAFIPDAVARGAVAVIAQPGTDPAGVHLIADEDPRRRLALIAARVHPGAPDTVIAVTGTNGKSSTVEFVRQIWAHAGRSAAALGTLGVRTTDAAAPLQHTTPDPVGLHRALSNLEAAGVTHLAMEASSHGIEQRRLDGVALTAVGFSNLTQDHLDYHPTFDAYQAAKLRLFSTLAPPGAVAVVNVDDPHAGAFLDAAEARGLIVHTVGWGGTRIKLRELTPRAQSQTLDLLIDGEEVMVELPLVGEFQAQNAILALGLARVTGVSVATGVTALAGLEPVPGRLELAGATADGAPVFVDYAHTPDGLDKLLRAVRPHTQGRVIAVFGCGGDRDPTKRAAMGATAARLADAVILTDDNPRSEDPAAIRAAARSGAPEAREIADRADAIAAGVAALGPDDALVIAGKGHETDQVFADRTVPFNDVEVARAALAARAPASS